MTFSLSQKKQIVSSVNDMASKTISLVVVEYKGVTVSEMTELRKKAREVGVTIKVVRNTLARKAFEGTSLSCVVENLKGPIFLAFTIDQPGAAAKTIFEFAKTNKKISVKSIVLESELLSASEIDNVAKLPTYDEAVSLLMRTMLAPIEKLVRTIAAPNVKLVRTLSAIKQNKENQN